MLLHQYPAMKFPKGKHAYTRHIKHSQKRLRIKIFVQQIWSRRQNIDKKIHFPRNARVCFAKRTFLHHLSIPHIQDLLLKYVIIFFYITSCGQKCTYFSLRWSENVTSAPVWRHLSRYRINFTRWLYTPYHDLFGLRSAVFIWE